MAYFSRHIRYLASLLLAWVGQELRRSQALLDRDSVQAMKAPAVSLLHLGTWGLTSLLCLACAATVTPPDTTPVYAEDATKGIEPIPVEYASVNDPEVKAIDGGASPCQKNAAGSPPPVAPVAETASTDAKDASHKKSANEEKDAVDNQADNKDAAQKEAATDKPEKPGAAAAEPAVTPAAPQPPAQ